MATPKLKARGKAIASKHPKFAGYESISKPSVKIMKCIGFQKFRYCGENRPGKKYQDKDFLQLALCHMSGKNVRVQIVCFDAERQNEIHPNGLVGRDCQEGVYTKLIPVSKSTQIFRVPYLRTERILTKKTKDEGSKTIREVFEARAKILPAPYREQCEKQSQENQKYDTTRVCFGVIVTMEESSMEPLFCLSNVVQNASEKTMLKIQKLSTQYVSAQEGGELDIFTTEDGPPITAGKCRVKVMVFQTDAVSWESAETEPTQDQILYKRVVTYRVPAYGPNPAIDSPLKASIELSCVQSGQRCSFDFYYEPGADSARRLATIHGNKPLRKRPYIPDVTDDIKVNGVDDIKLRVKEKVKSRQIQADSGSTYELNGADLGPSNLPVPVSTVLNSAVPTTAMAATRAGVPLHEQEDIMLAHDLATGEMVYLRTQRDQNPSSDLVMYVHDAGQALKSSGGLPSLTLLSDMPRAVAVPASEWNSMVTPSTAATSASTFRILDSTGQTRRPSADQGPARAGPTTRKKAKFINPWIVSEPENTPLINGDIDFTQPKSEAPDMSFPVSSSVSSFKQEPTETGPPVLAPTRILTVGNEPVPVTSHNLPSGTLISNFALNSNLPSLNSLFASGVLEGVRFDDSGTLLSSSVFEMVQPYIDNKSEK